MLTDSHGNEVELVGESALSTLRDELEQEDWSVNVLAEAEKIARQYGVAPTQPQRDELCRALQLAEIEALSRALSIHKGAIPEPVSVLNARAVDPITAVVRARPLLAPKKGKGIRVSEAASAYFADRNRQHRSAWTGQTTNQSRATLRMLAEFKAPGDVYGIDNEGKNCMIVHERKAEGTCVRSTFGDWSCTMMEAVHPDEWAHDQPPPR
jgi:hypothetical protein